MTQTQIPGLLAATAIRVADRLGYEVDALVDGLQVTLKGLLRPRTRVEWSDFVELLKRIEEARPAKFETFAEAWVSAMPLFNWVTAYVANPQQMLQIVGEACKRFWPFLNFTFGQLPDGRHDWQIEVAEPLAASAPFLRLLTVALRVMPRLVNAPDAQVEASVGPRRGHWRIALPATSSSSMTVDVSVGRLFSDMARELMELAAPTKRAPAGETLSVAEERVVELLVRGLSTKGIAQALGISVETVRSHLKKSMRKLGVHRQHELVVKALKRR